MTIALILHEVDKIDLFTQAQLTNSTMKKMLKGTVNIYNNLQHRPI